VTKHTLPKPLLGDSGYCGGEKELKPLTLTAAVARTVQQTASVTCAKWKKTRPAGGSCGCCSLLLLSLAALPLLLSLVVLLLLLLLLLLLCMSMCAMGALPTK
jgi:hypothetical protein